ncbi:MAG: FecR family protein [Candidatus Aureabacteria bacterium]|nr:FecR family protein [Candidatus Auribacterota bacterium]
MPVYAEKVGVIVSIKAPVMIQREGKEFNANLGEEVHLGDTVRTGIPGRVKVLLDGRVMLMVIENTEVAIEKHLYDQKTNTTNSVFDLKNGFVRTILEKFHDTSLDINSRNAIAGVRGTDFLMRYTPDRDLTQVYVLRGTVEVRNRLEGVPGPVSLMEKQWVEVAGSRAPGQPQALSSEAADALAGETTMPDQVSGKAQKAFKAAKGGKAGGRGTSKKVADGTGINQPPNTQVSVVGRDFIPPASVGMGGAAGAVGGTASARAADGSRPLPGGSGARVDQGGRPGDIGSTLGRPGSSGGVPDILGR